MKQEMLNATVPSRREQLSSRIAHHEERINQAVYRLYGLTPEEIAIVEQGAGPVGSAVV